jgi:hypothetical protein
MKYNKTSLQTQGISPEENGSSRKSYKTNQR